MQQSEAIDQIAAALAMAQGEIRDPVRNREVTVSSDKGRYKFAYATFDSIVEIARSVLPKHGLSYVQVLTTDNGKPVVVTQISHSSGQWMRGATPVVVEKQNAQGMGSGWTYAKRYALTAMLGLATDEDDDANAADGNHVEAKHDRKSNVTTLPERQAERPAPSDPKPQSRYSEEDTAAYKRFVQRIKASKSLTDANAVVNEAETVLKHLGEAAIGGLKDHVAARMNDLRRTG